MLKLWAKKHLMHPPATHVALATHQATQLLNEAQVPMPRFPVTRPKMICKLINDEEVSATLFRTLRKLCQRVDQAFQVIEGGR